LAPAPFRSSYSELLPIAWSILAVAFTTIYWSALSRLEGHFTLLTTLNAHGGMHFAASSGASGVVELGSLCLAARGAALGLIGISPTGIELLFLSGKGEFGATVSTL
jgi:hypothetical protein